ncbi:MAG: hypothetical protein IKQ37_08430 [Bacteroidaceae bacterium]|nr:hypothetical protein [Bacteroidaceae bacterium]
MIEREISERYFFNLHDFNEKGRRRKDGLSFRDVVREFERDFHARHSTEYALNFYGNSKTMRLLEKSCDAAPFLTYGMDLTQGTAFDAEHDPYINHEIDKRSKNIYVYGIDSAFMTEFDKDGYPILDEDGDIFPLTLLIDKTMRDNEVRLAVPTLDDGDETEDVTIDVPHFEYA